MVQLHHFSSYHDAAWIVAALYCMLYGGVLVAALPSHSTGEDLGNTASGDPGLVTYHSREGAYSVRIPADWQPEGHGTNVGFISQHRGVRLRVIAAISRPSARDLLAGPLVGLATSGRSVAIQSVRDTLVSDGPLVRIQYEAGSEPNVSTKKVVRLAKEAYVFYRGGRLTILTVWAPVGTDDTSLWKQIVESFVWC